MQKSDSVHKAQSCPL